MNSTAQLFQSVPGLTKLRDLADKVWEREELDDLEARAILKLIERMDYFMRELARCAENYRNAPSPENGRLLELAIKKARNE